VFDSAPSSAGHALSLCIYCFQLEIETFLCLLTGYLLWHAY